MASKDELYKQLDNLSFENSRLKRENEQLRTALYNIYSRCRFVLGIEARAEERERLKQQGSHE